MPRRKAPPAGVVQRALLVGLLAVILPLIPAEAPGFAADRSVLAKSWELLRLILIGVAVSYGLFSRKNAEPHEVKNAPPAKPDTPQSYVTHILNGDQPLFEDDEQLDVGDGEFQFGESKVDRLWSSVQYPSEPDVVVATNGVAGGGKPLSLPVRSLKTAPPRNADEAPLPSPIPWRSRSAKLEEDGQRTRDNTRRSVSFPRPATPVPTEDTSPPTRLSPSNSLNSDPKPKNISEGSAKRRGQYKFYPPPAPPPPPPPPPPFLAHPYNPPVFDKKLIVTRSFADEIKNVKAGTGSGDRELKQRHGLDYEFPESAASRPRSGSSDVRSGGGGGNGKSVRTVGSSPPAQTSVRAKQVERDLLYIDSSGSASSADEQSCPVASPERSAAEVHSDEENEVDKKADEFIARFREQIRLQRIESIKRSSGHRAVKHPNSTAAGRRANKNSQ